MQGPQILLTQQGAAASFDFTASFSQAAAGWDATASETYTSTAAFAQVAATWAAVASEAFAATGSFVQAAAAWSAVASETLAATATWTQAAASWDASANQTSDRDVVATFDQATGSWEATVSGPAQTGGMGGRYGPRIIERTVRRVVAPPLPEPVAAVAEFSQAPASWAAVLSQTDDEIAILLAA